MLNQIEYLSFVENRYAMLPIIFVVLFVTVAANRLRQEFVSGSSIDLAKSQDVWFYVLDVFLNKVASVRPIQYVGLYKVF